jgi:hypothetical protein
MKTPHTTSAGANWPTSTPRWGHDRWWPRRRPGRGAGLTPRRTHPQVVDAPLQPAHPHLRQARALSWTPTGTAGRGQFTVPLDPHGTPVPAAGVAAAAAHPPGASAPTARLRSLVGRPRRCTRRGRGSVGATRWPSSCPATAWWAPTARSPVMPPGCRARGAAAVGRRAAHMSAAHEAPRRGGTAVAGRAVGRVLPVHAHERCRLRAGGAGLRACGRRQR